MNVLVLLAVILFLLMVLIGGKKGVKSFISLFLNFGVIILTIFFMINPAINPITVTAVACVAISSINLFYVNGVNSKTKTAFVSTLITIAILLFFISVVTKITMIQGFGEEETEELGMFSLYIGLDFVKIAASVIIMSTIGAIADVAISITSPMRELFRHRPSSNRKELFSFGLSIGRDILGTNTNTIFFAFFGGYLALLLWFKDLSYSISEIANSKVFNAEIVMILCAGIGIALVIPIASWINAAFLVNTRNKEKI